MTTSVAYTALLTAREETVLFLSGLLHAERTRRGTRTGRCALTCFKQAVLVLRWFLDGTRLAQLATDNTIGRSTTYRYLHEGIDVPPRASRACTPRSWQQRPPTTPISASTAR